MRRDELTTVLSAINALTAHVDARLDGLESKLDRLSERIDVGFDRLSERIDRIVDDVAGLKIELAVHRHGHDDDAE